MKNNQKLWFILPMRCLLFPAIFIFCSMAAQKPLTGISHWWTIIAVLANIVTIGALWMVCKWEKMTYREMIRYEKKKGSFFQGFLFIVAMLLLGVGGMYFAGALCYGEFPYLAPMMIAPIPPCLAVINILVLPLTTTLAEDGLYLGYGVNRFSSKWAAVLIPAFFYALQHSFIPTLFDLKFIAYRFLSFLPLTLWICLQYNRKNCISYIMAGHWILNLATTMQIALTSFHPEIIATVSSLP